MVCAKKSSEGQQWGEVAVLIVEAGDQVDTRGNKRGEDPADRVDEGAGDSAGEVIPCIRPRVRVLDLG